MSKKKKLIFAGMGIVLVIIVICSVLLVVRNSKKEEIVYKETEAKIGLLAAGVTETGSVDVGTTTQSFELDFSQFTGESSFDFSTGLSQMEGMSGMSMPGQMSFGGAGSTQSGQSAEGTRTLEIEEVYVEAGEEIAKDAPLLKLTEESVESLRGLLEEDVTGAELVYHQAVTAEKQTGLEAQTAYDTNVLYGNYMQAEYDLTVKTLNEAVESKKENVQIAEEALADAKEQLAQKQELLTAQKKVLENAWYQVENTEARVDLYWWIMAWQTKESAQSMVDTLEEEIQSLNENMSTLEEDIAAANTELSLAQKDLESGISTAKAQLAARSFNVENAQEIFDVSTGQSAFDTKKASEDYEEAKEKLAEFDANVVDGQVLSASDGLITDVFVAAGDTLAQNAELISMNDYNAVTITLSIEEADMESAQLGNKVNVTIAAFPEEVFTGTVTEIGDAEIDSNTNKTLYTVTVTIQNEGTVFYQDMTAEVTFLTEDSAEVLYVPTRAIVTEGNKTYVKMRDEQGTVINREVVTGISDGINTEIKEGLSKDDIVLWESKVNQS